MHPELEELAFASIGHCFGKRRSDVGGLVRELRVDHTPGEGYHVGADIFGYNLVLGEAYGGVCDCMSDLWYGAADKQDANFRAGNGVRSVVDEFRGRRAAVPEAMHLSRHGLNKVYEERHDSRTRCNGIRLGLPYEADVLERVLVTRYNLRDP